MDASPAIWLADLWAHEGSPFVLGHALSMQAIPGGQATPDTIDAQNIAMLMRGGMRPQASGSPAAMRATRALLRRRMHLARQWAELLAHVQHTTSQEHLPAIGQKLAATANRVGGAERCADPAVHKSSEAALALSSDDEARLRDVALTRLNTATHHAAQTRYLLQPVPGIGPIRSRVWRYELHALDRFPTGPDFVSSGRLGQCAKESAGKRWGTAGTTIGKAQLNWAFSAAAVLCLRDPLPAPHALTRLEKHHAKGQALTGLAHKVARAVYDRLKRPVALATEQCFQREWRGADAPGASLDPSGMPLPHARDTAACIASLNAQARIGREARRFDWTSALAPLACGDRPQRLTSAAPPPRLAQTGQQYTLSLLFEEAGMREQRRFSVAATRRRACCRRRMGGDRPSRRVWCSPVGSSPSDGNQVSARDRVLTAPGPVKRKQRQNRSPESCVS